MANIIIRPDWHIPDREVTPEDAYRNRRSFLKQLGIVGAGALSSQLIGCSDAPAEADSSAGGSLTPSAAAGAKPPSGPPVPRNPKYDPGWNLTNEDWALTYNNYYEFSTKKDEVHKKVGGFPIKPWQVEISGLVEKPMTLDIADIMKQFPIEERVYKFRCVEAWGMIVPWRGFPLKALLDKVKPTADAKFVRFVTGGDPAKFPNWKPLIFKGYPLPYTEGLRLDEAMNDLTLVGTGLYGSPLATQCGAPIRIVVPWKYGYKSIKSINKIELVREQPKTLWQSLNPKAYPFESNVEPKKSYTNWSQATHRMIDTDARVRTELYNGYGKQVASLYKKA